jgi:hypothetical protein
MSGARNESALDHFTTHLDTMPRVNTASAIVDGARPGLAES